MLLVGHGCSDYLRVSFIQDHDSALELCSLCIMLTIFAGVSADPLRSVQVFNLLLQYTISVPLNMRHGVYFIHATCGSSE